MKVTNIWIPAGPAQFSEKIFHHVSRNGSNVSLACAAMIQLCPMKVTNIWIPAGPGQLSAKIFHHFCRNGSNVSLACAVMIQSCPINVTNIWIPAGPGQLSEKCVHHFCRNGSNVSLACAAMIQPCPINVTNIWIPGTPQLSENIFHHFCRNGSNVSEFRATNVKCDKKIPSCCGFKRACQIEMNSACKNNKGDTPFSSSEITHSTDNPRSTHSINLFSKSSLQYLRRRNPAAVSWLAKSWTVTAVMNSHDEWIGSDPNE